MDPTVGISSASTLDYLFSSTANSQDQLDGVANSALSLGIDLYTKKDYENAIKQFTLAAALSPFSDNSSSALDYKGKAYLQLGKTDEAIKTYKEAISIYPTRDNFHVSLGDIYLQNGQESDAEKEYVAALRLDSNSADSRYALGKVYLDSGRYSEAEAQFKVVTQLSPSSASGYYGLGQVFRKSGDFSNAIAQLNKAIKADKSFDSAVQELGYTYFDMGDLDKAEEQVTILSNKESTLAANLVGYIYENSAPKIVLAYSPNGFMISKGAGTSVSSLDSSLSQPQVKKSFTMRFGFSKEMDTNSVQNPLNWGISRASGINVGGAYNWGLSIPSTEVSVGPLPDSVTYAPDTSSADVTFSVTQNATGNGTIDPSHIMFQFSGIDAYGKAMDLTADEYSNFSQIV